MAFESISPNMNLVLPGVGQTLGPQYATDLNNSLTIIDTHNHTPGYGVPVPSSGLNINAELTMGGNNLIAIKSARFAPQSILAGALDLDCLFVNAVDLYFNDGNGNHVRLTQSGAVAGTPGSISNLTSPASATYVAGTQTFVWQSAANTPANMDNASIILRNLVANSFGLTLSPPAAMGANFGLTLPSLPISQKIMTLDASGNMAAPYSVDNATIVIDTNVIKVPALGIGNAQRQYTTQSKTADYTALETDNVILVDATIADVDITLATAVGTRFPITIKKTDTSANVVTLLTTGGQTMDGNASGSIVLTAPGDSITLQSDNADYFVSGRYRTLINGLMYKSSAQTIPDSTTTQIAYNLEASSGVTIAGNKITILYTGYYAITANLSWQAADNGSRRFDVTRNGSDILRASDWDIGSSHEVNQSVAQGFIQLDAGDEIKGFCYQDSGAPVDLEPGVTTFCSISVQRIAPLSEV